MAFKEKEMQLKSAHNATYKTVEGVTYFKLKSEFDGDYTKHCGLLGEEIDENFYFLRGYDIESIAMDENRNLIINRVDKDYAPIIVNIGEQLGNPSFEFIKENGTIIVTFPDGTTSKMDGFLVEGRDIRMATDSTFNGDGTIFNPLRLSPIEMTGTFAPADEYFDLTEVGGAMPKGKGKGYRIVTKEKIDNFGCLYPFSAVEKIQHKLTELKSQWRVATKEDWDELLNAVECKPNRDHDSKSCKWLGKDAGVALKSVNLWEKHDSRRPIDSTEGRDILGLSIYPLGITPDRNEILNQTEEGNYDAEGFGRLAGMWANTVNDEGNAYVKIFGYNEGRVDQDTYGKGARLSIRLVKDYNYSNYNEIETILGYPYPTELVYGTEEDNPYVKIWTKINFYSDAKILNGIRSEEWSEVTDSVKGVKVVYFINEWNGVEWQKKPMEEGDSVVIINYTKDGKEMINHHEWRIINEELIDTAQALKEEFDEEIDSIKKELAKEIENRINSDDKLHSAIINEGELRESVDKQLHSAIINEGELRKKTDDELLSEIQNESKLREAVDAQLKDAITEEVKLRESVDKQLHSAIVKEGEMRKKADDELLVAINNEAKLRENVDGQLRTAINNEASTRKNVDDQLLIAIKNEGIIRKNNDIVPDEYILNGDASIETVIRTYSNEIDDVKIKVSDDFFNFGEF